jgi:hypothetical protein
MEKVEKKKKIFRASEGIKPSKVTLGRTKKDPITVEGYIQFDFFTKPVKLKVVAKPEDWRQLADYRGLEAFGWFFWNHFIYPALRECEIKPRGRHKHTSRLVSDIKIEAAILYSYFSFWLKQGENKWPIHLINLKERAIKDKYENYIFNTRIEFSRKGGKARRLTEYCIEKIYGQALQSLQREIPLGEWASFLRKYKDKPTTEAKAEFSTNGLKPFEDPFNFYQKYIQHDRLPARFKEQCIQGKTPEEIATLAYSIPALNRIFTLLGIN